MTYQCVTRMARADEFPDNVLDKIGAESLWITVGVSNDKLDAAGTIRYVVGKLESSNCLYLCIYLSGDDVEIAAEIPICFEWEDWMPFSIDRNRYDDKEHSLLSLNGYVVSKENSIELAEHAMPPTSQESDEQAWERWYEVSPNTRWVSKYGAKSFDEEGS